MRRQLVALGAAVLAFMAPAGAMAGNASASTRCGRTYTSSRRVMAKVLIRSGGGTCDGAKALIRRAYKAEDTRHWDGFDRYRGIFYWVLGWKCSTGLASSEVFCSKGNRQIDGSTRSDDGWGFYLPS